MKTSTKLIHEKETLKVVSQLTDEHRAQIQNYLHATDLKVGLLVNLGQFHKVEHERFVL